MEVLLEFKTNILVERVNEENEFDSDNATPSYLAKEFKRDLQGFQ